MNLDIDITKRQNFQKGMLVEIECNGEAKRGYISKILSKEDGKPIKVELQEGFVGRVFQIPSKDDIEKENFKFFNLFFNSCDIYTIMKDNSLLLGKCGNLKCAYLFSSKEEAKKATKGTPMAEKPYAIGRLTRKKNITELLKKYAVDIFVIDMKHQLRNEELNDKEIQFRAM